MRRIALLLIPLFAIAGCSETTTAPADEYPVAFKRPVKPPPEPPPPPTPVTPVIAYEIGGPGDRGLWVADENGDGDVELVTRPTFFSSSWFPGGEGTVENPYRILMSPTTTGIIPMEVVSFVTTSGVPELLAAEVLTEDLRYVGGSVSPDGLSMVAAFTEVDHPEQPGSLVTSSFPTFAPETVYGPTFGTFLLATAWSPSGAHIAFVEVERADVTQVDLMVLDVGTGDAWPAFEMVCEGMPPRALSWSPVADELAYSCDDELMILPLDEGLVAAGPPASLGSGAFPAFSADGTRLLYVSRDRIYSKNLVDGSRDARLGNGRRPDWRR